MSLLHLIVLAITAMSACLKFVQRVTRAFIQTGGHDATCYPSLHIHTAKPGLIVGQMTVESQNVNRLGTLHGGVICSLTDTMGSLALASKGLYSTGVSTDIHTTFVRPAQLGETVKVEGRVINLGKTLAMTRFEMRHPINDTLLAYGSHTKFVGKASGHPENVEFDESGEKVTKGKQPEEWADA